MVILRQKTDIHSNTLNTRNGYAVYFSDEAYLHGFFQHVHDPIPLVPLFSNRSLLWF